MENNLNKIRHSLAHLLAIAVKAKYPSVKLGIGPVIEHGFYYDFDFGATTPTETELLELEKEMRALVSQDLTFEHQGISADEAKELFANEPYKLELITELIERGEALSIYKTGEFADLCTGPHINHTEQIARDAFRLTRVAGAYWRGSEKNKMLTRVYGVAFANKKDLSDHLEQQAEAEKRDHRKLGKELGLFIFSDLVGPGLPLYTPKGAAIRREIVSFSNELQREIGYEEVHTPNINKAELFKVSGHYEKYQDDMLRVSSRYTKEEYFLKPMNCPQHTQIYAAQKRSYKDLPVRLADFANLYRDEKPGELSGLTRLRSFAQDDGHCFCRPDQIKTEFENVLTAIKKALAVYGMDYYIRFSTWDPEHPEKYLGDPATWETAQAKLKEILIDNQIHYRDGVGEAAIYGPKMDFISRDSIGREWQISTIQIDFIMPKRFGLTYTDQDGGEKTPVMIHRAIVGSPERFLGILIEHYAGRFPTWLAPVQVKVLPISEKQMTYAEQVSVELKEAGIRVELDQSNETLGKKIRTTKMQKVPYLLVLGEKEAGAKLVTVEKRDSDTKGESRALAEFIVQIKGEIKERL